MADILTTVFLVIFLWSILGMVVYTAFVYEFVEHKNWYQRIFYEFWFGPVVWAIWIYEFLGTIGDKK